MRTPMMMTTMLACLLASFLSCQADERPGALTWTREMIDQAGRSDTVITLEDSRMYGVVTPAVMHLDTPGPHAVVALGMITTTPAIAAIAYGGISLRAGSHGQSCLAHTQEYAARPDEELVRRAEVSRGVVLYGATTAGAGYPENLSLGTMQTFDVHMEWQEPETP